VRVPRKLWILAIVVSIVLVAGFCYALIVDWNTPVQKQLPRVPSQSSGFGFGVLVGLAAGVVIGSLLALKKR
jgi:hypothetical protein